MAAGCYHGFSRTENSAIRSDDPKNPTLEPNMKWIGSPVTEIWPSEVRHNTKGALGTPILRKAEVVGATDHTVEKSDVGFLYAPCDHVSIGGLGAGRIAYWLVADCKIVLVTYSV